MHIHKIRKIELISEGFIKEFLPIGKKANRLGDLYKMG